MIKYKIDIMAALKEKGYSSYKLRKNRILSEKVMTDIRKSKVTMCTLNQVCKLLNCQPGEILEYLPDTADFAGEPDNN